MAVPRPLLLSLVGVVLLAATFLATRNARDQAAEAPSPPARQQAVAPKPAPKEAEKSKPRADRSRPSEKGTPGRSAPRPTVAPAVKRAVARNRLVVLFLYARGASDDRRVARSVASLRGRTRAAVFSDRISNLAKYGQIATSVGVTRAPSIVIIGKGRRGRLIEGYIDTTTLAQRVADSR
jgi:negative regulator of replication initiation